MHDDRNLPATVGQRDGDGAQKQVAFRLTDDGLTVGSRADDHKLSYAKPTNTYSITADIHPPTTLEETSASFCMLSDLLVTMKTITNQWDIILLFHSEEK